MAVTMNGVDFSSQMALYDLGALSLRKARRKYISAVNPSRGPITGGSRLVISGKGVGSAEACEFTTGTSSTITVPTSMVDFDTLNCITPPVGKSGEVTLSLPGISGSMSFFFYEPLNVMAVTPQIISVDLHSSEDDRLLKQPGLGYSLQITVFGSGFLAEGNRTFLHCWFEFEQDEERVAMDGSLTVLLMLAEVWDDSTASCFLPSELESFQHSIEPYGNDEVVLPVPPVRHVRIRLTKNLIDASSDWADLVIYEPPLISSISPAFGTIGGGRIEVSVRVASPLPTLPLSSSNGEGVSSWCCKVRDALVTATPDESDSSLVHCTIPESFEEGSVLVTLEVGEVGGGWQITPNDMRDINHAAAAASTIISSASAVRFTYLMAPQVVAIRPQNGPLMGGTPVIVSGAGMQPIPGLSTACTFTFTSGEVIVVNASYASSISVHCLSPAHPSVPKISLSEEEMTAAVAVSLNGGLQWSKSTANYIYAEQATITKALVTPTSFASDDLERRFQAIVYGSGFINSTELICILDGRTNIPCHYISVSTVACQLPIRNEQEPAILGLLEVSNNNGSDSSESVEILIPPRVNGEEISISPSSGPLIGGTAVSIFSTGPSVSTWLKHYIDMLLLHSENTSAVVFCEFGNGVSKKKMVSIAHLLEDNGVGVLSCTTPPSLYADYVSVTLGGY